MKERVIYRETFKRRKDEKLSESLSIVGVPKTNIVRVELQARGILESADSLTGQLEFYEVRIVLRPRA